jgi:hypothetical protein
MTMDNNARTVLISYLILSLVAPIFRFVPPSIPTEPRAQFSARAGPPGRAAKPQMSKAAEESGTRRSGRDRIRPLDFWANERVVYERGQICGVITNDVPHSSTEVAERPQRIATPPKVVASPPKRARSSYREGDSLTRGDTKRSRRPAALQGKGQSRGRDDTGEGEAAAPRPAAPPSQPQNASPKVPLQPPPKKRRREVIDVAEPAVAAVDEDALVGLEDLDQAAAAATVAAGAATETAPAVAAASSAPRPSAEVGAARAGGMARVGVERERERAGTEKYGGGGSSDGCGDGDGGGGGGNGESQVGSGGSGEVGAEVAAAATAATAAAVATAAAEAEVAEATARAEAMVVAAEKAAGAEAGAEAEAEEGGARDGEGRGEEAELEEAAQMGMAAAVALANQLDAHEQGDPHATLHGLPGAGGRLPARGGGGAAPLPGGLRETAAACDAARAAPVSEVAAVPTTRGNAPAFAPVPAPAKQVLDSRRWGRGWQYLVSRAGAGAADACWLDARDTPQPLIDDFEARSCSSGDPSASEQPREEGGVC